MVQFQITLNATANDDEIVACFAAIGCLLDQPDADNSRDNRRMSNWRQASVLEATGRARAISDIAKMSPRKDLWSAGNGPKLISILLTLAFISGPAALAGEGTAPPATLRPPIPVDDNAMPPLAPDLPNSAHEQPQLPAAAETLTAPPLGQTGGTRIVRVLLGSARTIAQFNLPDGALLKDMLTGDTLAQLPPQSRWQISLRAGDSYPQLSFAGTIGNAKHARVMIASRNEYHQVAFVSGAPTMPPSMVPIPDNIAPNFWLPALRASGTDIGSGRQYMLLPAHQDGTIGTAGKLYRGAIAVRPNSSGAFDLVNYIELEDYLQSVVPSEMPSGWPLEALKAQAIAARSYAVANLGKHEADGYDVKSNTEDQVYSGVACESAATNTAIAHTRGAVLRYQGNVVTAYFHSASGGWTEFSENVWSRPLPFLKAVPDYDDQSPYFAWSRSCPVAQAEQSLERAGKSVGALLSLMPVARGASPRVRWLLAVGSERSLLISGEEARQMFSLPSTCFNVAGSGQSYVFAGRGFGHGLGMSQWGAKKLAEVGYSANDILNYYYKDVRIERL